jgi:hypothetical protein
MRIPDVADLVKIEGRGLFIKPSDSFGKKYNVSHLIIWNKSNSPSPSLIHTIMVY